METSILLTKALKISSLTKKEAMHRSKRKQNGLINHSIEPKTLNISHKKWKMMGYIGHIA